MTRTIRPLRTLVVMLLAAFLFITAFLVLSSRADARPLPRHFAKPGLTKGECQPSGVWKTVLTVTSDQPGGTAHIGTKSTGFTLALPVSNPFFVSPDEATYTITLYVTWPDGFRLDLPSQTATRPPGGCQPTTSTPPTTTCEQAVPPKDCNPGTSVPPPVVSTTPPPAPTTTPTTGVICEDGNPPSIPVEDGTYVCPEYGAPSAPTTVVQTTAPKVTSQVRAQAPARLPATGPWTVFWFGLGGLLLLVLGLIAYSQRRRPAPTWPHKDLQHQDPHVGYHRIRSGGQPGKTD